MWIFIIIAVIAIVAGGLYYFLKIRGKKDSVVTPVPIPAPVPIPEPVPIPVTVGPKPTPPFPSCPFGPKPTDKSGLASYLSRYISDPIVKVWIDYLTANPADLDWVWSEFKQVN